MKRYLITGVSYGIGKECTTRLLKQENGVIVAARTESIV
jgi:Short-chain dehydrogenases of various substrate specificities